MGYAIVEKIPRSKERVVVSGCIQTSSKDSFFDRLTTIGNEVETLIQNYQPDAVALEKLFFATNAKTAMSVSEARGVIIYATLRSQTPIAEYTPLQIKTTIAGSGRADKKQMMSIIPRLCQIEKMPKLDDEFDAIAIALTYIARRGR